MPMLLAHEMSCDACEWLRIKHVSMFINITSLLYCALISELVNSVYASTCNLCSNRAIRCSNERAREIEMHDVG